MQIQGGKMSAKFRDIEVTYIDSMGNDARVLNIARTSFNKWKEEDTLLDEHELSLLEYLATGLPKNQRHEWKALAQSSKHWSPFAHCFLTVRCRVPLFLARQLSKHQVGLSWNEESRRYIDTEPTFWIPKEWHVRPKNAKQGSAGVHEDSKEITEQVLIVTDVALFNYSHLIQIGVAPEEARMILPQNTMVNYIWSGSVMSMIRVLHQRLDSHAQLAAQDFAKKLKVILEEHFPHSIKAFSYLWR